MRARSTATLVVASTLLGCTSQPAPSTRSGQIEGYLTPHFDLLYHRAEWVFAECADADCSPQVALPNSNSVPRCRLIASEETRRRLSSRMREIREMTSGESEFWQTFRIRFTGNIVRTADEVYVSPHSFRCEADVLQLRSIELVNLADYLSQELNSHDAETTPNPR